MLQVIHQTPEEKIAMYMKLTKRELATMLVNSNAALEAALERERNPILTVNPQPFGGTTWNPPVTISRTA